VKSRPAVLMAVANRAYGGAERHVADLSAGLARRGYRVGCLFPAGSGLEERLTPGVKAFPFDGFQSGPAFAAGLVRVVGVFRPDLVHLHGPRATLLGRWILRLASRSGAGGRDTVEGALRDHPTGGGTGRIPGRRPVVVSTAHGWIPRRLVLRSLYEAVYLRTARFDDMTIAVSRDTARRFGRWAPRLRVVPNGVERPEELPPYPASPDGPVVRLGFVGRLTEEKDYPLAVKVYRGLRRALPEKAVELHVYGHGPLLEKAEGKAHGEAGRWRGTDARGAGEQAGPANGGIILHGWVDPDKIPGILSGLTLLLLTSREEGWPYVVLEAMAAGCPVVATAVGGLPEIIDSGRTGWLFPPGDARAGAAAVAELVQTPGREAAWRRVGEFCLEAMVDDVEQAYGYALGHRRDL